MSDKKADGLGKAMVIGTAIFVVVCIVWDLLSGIPPIAWVRGVTAAIITLVLELIAAFLIWKVWRNK